MGSGRFGPSLAWRLAEPLWCALVWPSFPLELGIVGLPCGALWRRRRCWPAALERNCSSQVLLAVDGWLPLTAAGRVSGGSGGLGAQHDVTSLQSASRQRHAPPRPAQPRTTSRPHRPESDTGARDPVRAVTRRDAPRRAVTYRDARRGAGLASCLEDHHAGCTSSSTGDDAVTEVHDK